MASKRVRVVTDALQLLIETSVRKLQLRAFQALTTSSPVLTGWFRARWSPGVGAPTPAKGSPSRPVSLDIARTQAAALFADHQQAATLLASGYTLSQGPVFIVNDTPYGVYLNQGTSAQAPAMFVEQALAQAVDATRREIAAQ